MSFRGFHSWAIYDRSEDPNLYATFSTRKDCIKWLETKKEEYFFETGNMDLAEEKWGLSKFRFEEVFVLTRESFLNNFGPVKWEEMWNYDI